MIKFEEHEGKLFLMPEEPVPLKEKDTNVLVQFITHGIIGEYVMEHWLDCGQENVPIFVDSVDGDGDVTVFIENGNEHHCCPFPMFEIIGTLVKEGSKEWALYQMMHGKWVYNPSLEKHKSDKLDTRYLHAYGKFGQDIIVKNTLTGIDSILGAANISHWTNYAEPSGWQLYEPEPKPLLADARVGDLCEHRNGDWSQIIDTNGTYIQGQPIRTTLKDTKGINRNFCLSGSHFVYYAGGEYDIIHTEPLAPEGTAEWAWQMSKLGTETKCSRGKIRISDSGMIEVCYNGMAYAMPLTQSAENRQYSINKIRECSPDGWQLYKEPESQYKVGDWVEIECQNKPYHKQVLFVTENRVGFEFSGTTPSVCFDGTPSHIFKFIRKLSPSQVVIDFGSGIKGWIRRASNHTIEVYNKANCWLANIRYDMLDTETSKLVEGLLNAQEEEK